MGAWYAFIDRFHFYVESSLYFNADKRVTRPALNVLRAVRTYIRDRTAILTRKLQGKTHNSIYE
jgi:hypothetical protein